MLINTYNELWYPNTARSMYIVGPPGAGKTTFMLNLAASLIEAGSGLAIIDTHDLAPGALDYIPKKRFRDVIWLDAAEGNIALNLIEYAPGQSVAHLLDAFQSIYHFKDDAYRLLRFALIVHRYNKNTDISHVLKMLQDDIYMREVVGHCKDPFAWNYWSKEYAEHPERLSLHDTPRLLADAQNPVKAALEELLGEPSLRKMFCVPKSKISFKTIIDRGQVLICSVPKTLGERNAGIVQALILSMIRSAGFTRTLPPLFPEELPAPFPIFLDEFETVANPEVIESILAELRKYAVPLILAHHGQGNRAVEAALRYCETKLCWRPSGRILETKFAGFDFEQMQEDAKRLGYYNGVAVIEGAHEFSGYPLPKKQVFNGLRDYARPEQVKNHSKVRYAVTKSSK